MGILYGVGVGPGDPELITVKAVRIIKNADIIAVPNSGQKINVAYNIASLAVQEISKKPRIELDMPMIRDRELLEKSHQLAAEKIISYLQADKNVAFLTLGDPTVYSTYAYISKIVSAKGFNTQIISGITSFCAAAARLNISLSEWDETIHIVPASHDGFKDTMNLSGTKVLMKSGKEIGKIKNYIKNLPSSPLVQMVERCGMPDERIFTNLDEIDENSGYFSLIIVKDCKVSRKI